MSQRGWLTKEDRKKNGKVWVFHWYKARPRDGKRVENTAVVGQAANFSKESIARRNHLFWDQSPELRAAIRSLLRCQCAKYNCRWCGLFK
jgi:hypothetical protein